MICYLTLPQTTIPTTHSRTFQIFFRSKITWTENSRFHWPKYITQIILKTLLTMHSISVRMMKKILTQLWKFQQPKQSLSTNTPYNRVFTRMLSKLLQLSTKPSKISHHSAFTLSKLNTILYQERQYCSLRTKSGVKRETRYTFHFLYLLFSPSTNPGFGISQVFCVQ